MEALVASYRDDSSDSDSGTSPATPTNSNSQPETTMPLPPPPLSLLTPPDSLGTVDYLQTRQASRVRSFPHVDGNYALHVYIPVLIPLSPKKYLVQFLKKVASVVSGLHAVDVDVPLNILCKDDQKLEQVALGREFHISLGRTVPIRVHQIDSVVAMLRQKLQFQKRYWIDFSKWEVFVNDDDTRTFLSIEIITGGLVEITRQIQVVNEVYKLHNLPEFYKDPRPHISLAWAFGSISDSIKRAVEAETKRSNVGDSLQSRIFTSKFSGIECKIGNKTYKICKFSDEL
ncbi:HVSL domain-containing protein [Cephalotus follicularis]|uniref:U6 snRNA phosphodiesterase n=1 Tax=Cephalotus follicularis TaxID=3775 RepID=A0A1Q3BZW6_CEPFO|nr:HVSL domain-containing protein [Cephalotus follicularis]